MLLIVDTKIFMLLFHRKVCLIVSGNFAREGPSMSVSFDELRIRSYVTEQ